MPLIAAALGGLACDSPVGLGRRGRQPGEQPATLNVLVLFADSAAGVASPLGPPLPGARVTGSGVTVRAYLTSGVDGDGDVRRVESDTLRLLDTTLTAARAAGGGSSNDAPRYPIPTYATFIPLPERDFASRPVLITRAPTIRGLTALAPPAATYAVGRAGPDTVTVSRGGDLVLALALPADSGSRPGPTEQAQWSVQVQGDLGAPTVLSGPGLPPAVVRIPAGILPASARGELVARLFAGRFAPPGIASMQFDPRAYRLALRVESGLAWRVRLAR